MTAEPVAQAWAPACMDAAELDAWQEMNHRLIGRAVSGRPCADCTLGYASEMRAIGRCNGTPEGVEEDPDMDQPAPIEVRLTGRVAVDVSPPPCASCAHEPVCSLRMAVEGLGEIPVAAPSVPAGLRITLSAAVACDHFLRDKAKPRPVRVLAPHERGGQATAAAREWNGGPLDKPRREISEATRRKMRQSAIAARARKLEGQAGA